MSLRPSVGAPRPAFLFTHRSTRLLAARRPPAARMEPNERRPHADGRREPRSYQDEADEAHAAARSMPEGHTRAQVEAFGDAYARLARREKQRRR